MVIFIPEWTRVSGRDLQVKRVLNALDEGHCVRRPVRAGACAADIFVQHRVAGWLALAFSSLPFSDLDLAQLFAPRQRELFDQRLAELTALASAASDSAPGGLAVLLVMWACTTQEVRQLQHDLAGRQGLRLVSREQFCESGSELVEDLLRALPAKAEQHLMGTWFPEAEIAEICTARRFLPRDNSARLTRYFLDAEQEGALKLDLDMPGEQQRTSADLSVRLVNGVAGSGKTLIAINRALLLAELFPQQRILVLIHNTPIVADLKERLHQVRGGLPRNVEVLTFYSWICQQWRRMFGAHPKLPDDPHEVADMVRHLRLNWPELKASDAQLLAELDFIDDNLIVDEDRYLSVSRGGRGFVLRAADRSRVWALYQHVSQHLQSGGLQRWSALPRAICLAVARHRALRRYDHIVVDEAQFFAPSWFQVLKRSQAERGQLFLCADPNQGFMKNRLSWKSAGLEVAGRTRKLHRSYRTTKAILHAASAVLAVLGPGDRDDYLEPDYAGMEAGTRPMLVDAASPQDAIDRLVNELEASTCEGAVSLGAFLVVYGENTNKGLLHRQRFGTGNVWWFNKQDQKKAPPQGHGRDYLRMAYLDTATGLEAGIVFLIGMEPVFVCSGSGGDGDEEQAERRIESARKLYMAMTRAARRLVVVSSQRLPAEIEALFDRGDESPMAAGEDIELAAGCG